jgi:glutaredoxin
MKVVVYSQRACVPCKALKSYLNSLGVDYEEKDVAMNPEAFDELIGMGFRGTPVLKVGDKAVQGFNPQEVAELLGK